MNTVSSPYGRSLADELGGHLGETGCGCDRCLVLDAGLIVEGDTWISGMHVNRFVYTVCMATPHSTGDSVGSSSSVFDGLVTTIRERGGGVGAKINFNSKYRKCTRT